MIRRGESVKEKHRAEVKKKMETTVENMIEVGQCREGKGKKAGEAKRNDKSEEMRRD